MKRTLLCCIAVVLMSSTCLANPMEGFFDDESLPATSSRLVQNYVHITRNHESGPLHPEKIRQHLLDTAGRQLVDCYVAEGEEGLARFAGRYQSLPDSLKPSLTPVIGSLMEYLFSSGLDARAIIHRSFPDFERQFTSRPNEGGRETVSWIVRAPAGTRATLTVIAFRAGGQMTATLNLREEAGR